MNSWQKFFIVAVFLLISNQTIALTIKIGALAPEGTNWSKNLKKMIKEIKNKTDGKVKIKAYLGGVQGDEHDVLRKIRVGQLHGGIFTGKTLGDINGDIRSMEVPFTFEGDQEKAQATLNKLKPHFNKGLTKKKFVNLGFIELGMVYFVSQKKTGNLKSLEGVKIWSWDGDPLAETMLETMKLVSVPLPLPDVLSSLSTGIIEAAYAPPMGIVALQWSSKIKYLVDFPISYSVGAFLIDRKSWDKISAIHKKIIMDISKVYVEKINLANAKDNVEALAAMKGMGIEILKFPPEDIEKGRELRKVIIEKLSGKLFSKETLNLMNDR